MSKPTPEIGYKVYICNTEIGAIGRFELSSPTIKVGSYQLNDTAHKKTVYNKNTLPKFLYYLLYVNLFVVIE